MNVEGTGRIAVTRFSLLLSCAVSPSLARCLSLDPQPRRPPVAHYQTEMCFPNHRYQELCHFQLEQGQGDAPIWRCTQEPLKLLSNAFISLRDQSSSFSANREML